jgi:type I restriction enzyme S subunit
VPEGWEKPLFASQLELHVGGGWGQDDYTSQEGEPAYVIRGTDFEAVRTGDFHQVGLRYHKESSLPNRRLIAGDILFEVSGGSANQPIGRTLLITPEVLEAFDEDMICASFCKRLVPIDKDLAVYLFLFLDHIRSTGELLAYKKDSASALQNFNFKAFLEGQYICVPPSHLLLAFSEIVWTLLSQAAQLAITIDRLVKARDLLLPRLMNGEIPV